MRNSALNLANDAQSAANHRMHGSGGRQSLLKSMSTPATP